MSTFFMFGRYSSDAVKYISGQRTEEARKVVEDLGGEVQEIYALLGEYDLVFIVRFPNMTDAMKAAFYPAEGYHQDYAIKHPYQPYIVYNDAPKVENLKKLFPDLWREKAITVTEAEKRH